MRMVLTQKIKLILVLSIILFISFISLSLINYTSAEKTVRRDIVSSSLPLMRENIYSEIQKEIIPPLNIASLMSNDSFLINWAVSGEKETTAVTQYLQEIHQRYGYFSTFFISARTRNYYHFNGILKQISPEDDHDVWFYRFTSSEKRYELDVDSNQAAGNTLTIFINFRVEDFNGDLIGVTGVGIKMENFTGLLKEKQEKYNRRIYLTDKKGLIQAHSEQKLIENVSLSEKNGISGIAEKLLVAGNQPVNESYIGENGRVLVTSRYIPEIDWFIIVEQDEETALGTARKALWRTILTGLITSIIIAVLSGMAINHFQKRLEELAVRDGLTKVANRRQFETQFERIASKHSRYATPFSLLIIDVDNFKSINDTEGHQTGDRVLIAVSSLIEEHIRPEDLLARWGGDEFVLLLECEAAEAYRTAERLRGLLAESGRLKQIYPDAPVTISVGIAEFEEADTLESVTMKADKALYQSKREGRNRVTLYKKK